ncbi:MAG: uncharacterized protein KVP18_002919 [Porospora cf. gigantea A]|uniref:uncharacterized protein n=1 Tax=Porospora cf. gigantea A TaxID=2853593 RepID=UPI003559DED9|nr:MAG: hypothetical protein KVP18_002919 [Porospora cf. gigantea A]
MSRRRADDPNRKDALGRTYTDRVVEEVGKLQNLHHPKARHKEKASVLRRFEADADWAASTVKLTQSLNGARPKDAIESLKQNPVHTLPKLSKVYSSLWGSKRRSAGFFDDVMECLKMDLADLESSLPDDQELQPDSKTRYAGWHASGIKSTSRRHNDSSVILKNLNEGGLTNPKTKMPFWRELNPDTEVYTDSEGESDAQFPPHIGSLRKTLRQLKRSEQARLLHLRSVKVFDDTLDMEAVAGDNIGMMDTGFHTKRQAKDHRRQQLRAQWDLSGRYGAWRGAWQMSCHNSKHPKKFANVYRQADFELLQLEGSLPPAKTSLVLNLLKKHALMRPESNINEGIPQFLQDPEHTWIRDHSVHEWFAPKRIDGGIEAVFAVETLPPGQKIYLSHLDQVWGRPFGQAYSATRFPLEFMTLLKKSSQEALCGLHAVKAAKPRRQADGSLQTQILEERTAHIKETKSETKVSVGSTRDLGSTWGAPLEQLKEEDSDEEEDKKWESVELAVKEHPERAQFEQFGFGLDSYLVRTGVVGRFRPNWDEKRRRNPGLELLAENHNRPLPPFYASSEDDSTPFIQPQSKFRQCLRGEYQVVPAPQSTVWPRSTCEASAPTKCEGDYVDRIAARSREMQPQSDAWLSQHRKPRVPKMNRNADADPSSSFPLGLLLNTTTFGDRELQLVGVDTVEFMRRHGHQKLLEQELQGFNHELRCRKEFVVVLDEAAGQAVVAPLGKVDLYLQSSPQEVERDFYWKLLWEKLLSGGFAKDLELKALRCQEWSKVGSWMWQEDLDNLKKISDKIVELHSFREPKYILPRTHTASAARKLAKDVHPDLDVTRPCRSADVWTESESDGGSELHLSLKHYKKAKKAATDPVEPEHSIYLPQEPTSTHAADVERAVAALTSEAERLFDLFGYAHFTSTMNEGVPEWAWAFTGSPSSKTRLRRSIPGRYRQYLPRYLADYLPSFLPRVTKQRHVLMTKQKEETEYLKSKQKV